MIITFHIGTYYQNDEDVWVNFLDLIPFLPPCKFLNKLVKYPLDSSSPITYLFCIKFTAYFLSPRNIRNLVDDTYYTAPTTLTWKEKRYLMSFVADIETFKSTNGAGPNDGPYLPLVHTLNKNNISRKCMVRF